MEIQKCHGTLEYTLMRSEEDFLERYHSKFSTIEDWFDEFGETRRYPIILIERMEVDNSLRDMGYGTRLLSELEDIGRSEGVTLIFLKVGYSSMDIKEKNIYFYKKSGYEIVTPSSIHGPHAFKLL